MDFPHKTYFYNAQYKGDSQQVIFQVDYDLSTGKGTLETKLQPLCIRKKLPQSPHQTFPGQSSLLQLLSSIYTTEEK